VIKHYCLKQRLGKAGLGRKAGGAQVCPVPGISTAPSLGPAVYGTATVLKYITPLLHSGTRNASYQLSTLAQQRQHRNRTDQPSSVQNATAAEQQVNKRTFMLNTFGAFPCTGPAAKNNRRPGTSAASSPRYPAPRSARLTALQHSTVEAPFSLDREPPTFTAIPWLTETSFTKNLAQPGISLLPLDCPAQSNKVCTCLAVFSTHVPQVTAQRHLDAGRSYTTQAPPHGILHATRLHTVDKLRTAAVPGPPRHLEDPQGPVLTTPDRRCLIPSQHPIGADPEYATRVAMYTAGAHRLNTCMQWHSDDPPGRQHCPAHMHIVSHHPLMCTDVTVSTGPSACDPYRIAMRDIAAPQSKTHMWIYPVAVPPSTPASYTLPYRNADYRPSWPAVPRMSPTSLASHYTEQHLGLATAGILPRLMTHG
jgi:hypothetical protein